MGDSELLILKYRTPTATFINERNPPPEKKYHVCMFFRINFDQPYTHRRQNHDLTIYCAQIAIFRYPKRNNLLPNHDILRNPIKFGTGNKIKSRMYVFRVNSNQPCIQRRQNHYFAIFFNILRSDRNILRSDRNISLRKRNIFINLPQF